MHTNIKFSSSPSSLNYLVNFVKETTVVYAGTSSQISSILWVGGVKGKGPDSEGFKKRKRQIQPMWKELVLMNVNMSSWSCTLRTKIHFANEMKNPVTFKKARNGRL